MPDRRTWMDTAGWTEPEQERQVLVWHRLNGVMVSGSGRVKENRYFARWMEIPDEWTLTAEKRPTAQDADARNCVLVRDLAGDAKLRGWYLVDEKDIPAWMPLPKQPADAAELRRTMDTLTEPEEARARKPEKKTEQEDENDVGISQRQDRGDQYEGAAGDTAAGLSDERGFEPVADGQGARGGEG